MKHIKVVEKDSWIHITEAKKFESLLVRIPRLLPALGPEGGGECPTPCSHAEEQRPPAPTPGAGCHGAPPS